MSWKKPVWSLLLLLFTVNTLQAEQFAFRISFSDKAGSADISQPLTFLSQRSLDRRAQWGIAVDATDLPVSPDYIDSVLTLTGGVLHTSSRWLNTCVVLLDDSDDILPLQNKPYITDISLVGYFHGTLHNRQELPEKTDTTLQGFQKTSGSPAHYGATWDQTELVHGDCLHDAGFTGQGVLIAVLDAGFNFVDTGPAFQTLYSSGRILDTWNFVRDNALVYGYDTHGTEVLSTMCGDLPGTYMGAAPLAQYALYITEDNTSEQPVEMDNMIAGFERADSIGADIVSSSLGYDVFTGLAAYTIPPAMRDGQTVPVSQAANMATAKGMLMVISAGNEGSGGLLVPGDADSTLTIGNVSVNKLPASSSGHGPNAAGHIKPDVCALGNPAAVMRNTANVGFSVGTSLSTPQIAGYAACLMQGNPGTPPYRIKAAIRQSSHMYPAPTHPQLGYGVPDFCQAWLSLDLPNTRLPGFPFHAEVFPNPSEGQWTLRMTVASPRTIRLRIMDVSGREIQHMTFEAHSGANLFPFSLPLSAMPGIYFGTVTSGQNIAVVRLVWYP